MKTQVFCIAALLAAGTATAQFNTSGIASYDVPSGTLSLVPTTNVGCGQNTMGAGWSTTSLDFTAPFVLEFDARLTTLCGSGADGFAVAFGQNINSGSINGHAGFLGYYNNGAANADFNQSLGIEFDVFQNGSTVNDPSSNVNHVMVARDGNHNSVVVPARPILPSGATIEDGVYRHYRIEWSCADSTLQIAVNDSVRFDTTVSINSIFSAPSSVTWGFTGGRGNSGSEHLIKNIGLSAGERCVRPCFTNPRFDLVSMGLGYAADFYVSPNSSSSVIVTLYEWNFGDGSPVVVSPNNPYSHTFPGPGNYYVSVRIIGYNTVTRECCYADLGRKVRIDEGHGGRPAGMDAAEPDAFGGLVVSPNPSHGQLKVTLNEGTIGSIALYNASGSLVAKIKADGTQTAAIDVSKLPGGIYFIEVVAPGGHTRRARVSVVH